MCSFSGNEGESRVMTSNKSGRDRRGGQGDPTRAPRSLSLGSAPWSVVVVVVELAGDASVCSSLGMHGESSGASE